MFNFVHFFVYSFYVYLKAFTAYFVTSVNFFLKVNYTRLDSYYGNYTYWTNKIAKIDNDELLFKSLIISMFLPYVFFLSVLYVWGTYYLIKSFYSFLPEMLKIIYN